MLSSGVACLTGPRRRTPYRFIQNRDRWLIYDVLVDQVSMVDAYHDRFAGLMRRGGFRELLGRMEDKVEAAGQY
jgi:ABC-type transporter MlaC component